MLVSTSPRPTKRLRTSSESRRMLLWPPRGWAPPVPILLRKFDFTTVIAKCLEAVANERLLRSSDLIDKVIADQFVAVNEIHNTNNTNVKDAKNFICKQIGPILYQIVNQYLESVVSEGEAISPSENSQSPIQPKKQENDNENTPVDVPAPAEAKQESKMPPPLFPGPMEPFESLGVPTDPTATPIDHTGGTDIGNWLSTDSSYPFRKNYPVQSSPVVPRTNGTPVEHLQGLEKFRWPQSARSKSDAGIPDDTLSMASPVKTKPNIARAQSISGKPTADQQETRSVVSTTRRRFHRSGLLRSCTFCGKELPSPSARREHEAIHIFQLCQYKQYQCKQPNCAYRSHRPREIFHHMKNRHAWAGKVRGGSTEGLMDHGPLSDEKMASLRQQYHAERSDGINLTTANFGFPTPSIKIPDRDLQTEGDDIASQHNTIISMDYSYTQNTPIPPHLPAQLSSSMFGMGTSTFDDTNSLIMRDNLDQSSQVDYTMNDYTTNFRNSIGAFTTSAFLPQGPQLLGVGAAHAGSTLTNIPPTIDVEEDAQGENDVEWSENLVVSTMKGS
ncbi:hypothetical protein TWF281_001411 [Arthrobotrys megalospora]